ncbi:MAG: hypothetical protein KF795_30345 [Labilithrix sp.]|nr:hypothetical protein [Labilithrix sp.]
MTRRNEDSGLIDLDALLREAGGSTAGEAPAPAPTPAPTPAPMAVRSEALSTPEPASDGRPTVRPPAREARESLAAASPAASTAAAVPASKPAPHTTPAREATSTPAPASTPKADAAASALPPAPSTTPSRLWPDSLDAVTTEPTTAPRKVAEGAAAPPVAAEARTPPARGGRRIAIGATLAIAAIAGAVAFVRARGASETSAVAAAATAEPRAIVEAPSAAPAPTPIAEAPAALGVNMEELPTVASAATASVAHPITARVTGGPAKAPSGGEPAPAATLTEAALEAAGPSAAGQLGDAMRGAVGPRETATGAGTETTSGPHASQVRPSPGAVVGALGSVLPAARACLGPDAPIRSGLVVFKSDGTVARVELRGSKPEDECVRSALSKAKVAPFADDTFSTRVTVRP